MKRFLSFALLISSPTIADNSIVESIERFTDIFGISFSKVDDTTVATLDVNYQLTDDLRLFGDIDTEENWEAGMGYSIWQGETFYTENTIKASEYKASTGIFGAKVIHDDWTVIGDIHYNHKFDQQLTPSMTYLAADTVEYSLGAMWSPIEQADLLVKFNQEIGWQDNEYHLPNRHLKQFDSRTNRHYYEVATFFNLKYVKPSVTYTIHPENRDKSYVEFGLAFDF